MGVFRDQVYAPLRKSSNRLDIYVPKAGARHPVVLFVHGGKWSSGDKGSSVFCKPQAFVRQGFVFVSVDYRLSPRFKFPDHIKDVTDSIAWVNKNIERFNGDPHSIYLMGHSAGAHLVALTVTDQGYFYENGTPVKDIKGVVLLDGGSYNLTATARSSVKHDLLNSVFGRDPKVWWSASPIRHVLPGKYIPPTLTVFVPNRVDAAAQAQAFCNALKRVGVDATLFSTHEKTHASLNEDFGKAGDRTTDVVFKFLRRCNRPKFAR